MTVALVLTIARSTITCSNSSKDYSITEQLGLEGPLVLSSCPAQSRVCYSRWLRAVQSGFPPRMEMSQSLWATCSSVWSHLLSKSLLFLALKQNFLYSSLCPLPTALSPSITKKGLAPSFSFPHQVFIYNDKIPLAPLLQAEQSQLSQPSLTWKISSPLIIFRALLWTCFIKFTPLLYQHWVQHPRCHQGLAEEKDHLPQPLYTSSWATGLYICKKDKGMGTHMGSPRKGRTTPALSWLLSLPPSQDLRVSTPTILKCTSMFAGKLWQAEEEEEGPSAWLPIAEQASYMFEMKTACALKVLKQHCQASLGYFSGCCPNILISHRNVSAGV